MALLVQLVALEPQELEDTDLPRLSELTFLVLFVAVLLQSATQQQPIRNQPVSHMERVRRIQKRRSDHQLQKPGVNL